MLLRIHEAPALARLFTSPTVQGWMGAIFSPCLALAWLLTSRVALSNCETVLACGVLREEDLDGAFREGEEGGADGSLALVEASNPTPSPPTSSRCCIEAVLQGLAALEVRSHLALPSWQAGGV